MEEDIKILENYLKAKMSYAVVQVTPQFQEALENLIKGYKEKDKIINLMAGAICYEPLPTEKYCVFRDYNCPVVGGNKDCRECVISFFQKESE